MFNLRDRADKKFLREQWVEIHNILYATGTNCKPNFSELDHIVSYYKSKDRHYHGIQHIVYGLKVLHQMFCASAAPPSMRDGALLRLAFFYHDVIYDVHRKDNEKASADWAVVYLRSLGISITETMRVAHLIEETANHQGSTSTDPLWPLMNDADLAIMMAPPKVYAKYTQNVWKEYRVLYSRKDFVTGRLQFVENFSKKPIFRSELSGHENQAHFNLGCEYSALLQESIAS